MPVEVLEHELEDIYNTAVELARKAGEAIREAFYKEKNVEIKQSAADLVTETDQAVEKMIQDLIMKKYPHHKFIGEETVSADGSACSLTDDFTWIIDPVDGTTNFVHSIPEVAFSCGILVNKQVVIGVIYVPILDQMYTAKKGQGSFVNGKKLSVSSVKELKSAAIIMEGGSSRDPDVLSTKINNIHSVLKSCHGIRAYGSAAINLCKVASGMYEAYVEFGIHCWDIVAGMLILQEAGGVNKDTTGEEIDIMRRRIIGANCENIITEIASKLTQIDVGRD
ncbi:hypothetical protein LOTGIDRAFT_178401 [Lottia gigantea]|uniref:Inositol-1-monophosphatase n=1 Tax=Lottia gigantea TaxID=225164 RepID=V4C0V3_LOTGI|nr:hypothetical protein LOTGIDRAFT_178401 [Lottia gigantea]ESO95084.1 hypothetical protein LOTGIDRAFT_178401 [Lottia gigantea]